MVKIEKYKAKKVLNTHKHIDGAWFWTKYTAYPYLGCQFGCEYCYCRDKHYCPFKNPDDFGKLIRVKENAPQLLRRELEKVERDVIGVGDWQPIEKKFRLSREMLKVCLGAGYPVYLLEKSPLVLDDLDLVKKIDKKAGANISFSIITDKDDATRKIFEPNAPTVKSRFEAMEKIAKAGIETGTVMIPILPFVYDSKENIEAVIKATKKAGGKFVLAGGLTLWGEVKFYYYQVLNKHFPKLVPKYQKIFDNEKAMADYWRPIAKTISGLCAKHKILDHIPRPVKHYPKKLHFNKKIAAKFYLKARDYQESGQDKYKEWAYRKAAWAIDDLEESLVDIYKKSWLVGIQKIQGIGNRLAHEIEKEIKEQKNA